MVSYSHRKRTKANMVEGINPITNKTKKPSKQTKIPFTTVPFARSL